MNRPIDALLQTFIDMIAAGTPPWRQPWARGGTAQLPLRADGEPFTGSNSWILAFAGAEEGVLSPYWFTFRQALAIGAPVRKGAKGRHVILFKTRTVEAEGEQSADETRTLRFLKTYVVFNGDQLDGLPDAFRGSPVDGGLRGQMRDAVIDAIPAEIVYGGDKAFYLPAVDRIHMPKPERFESFDEACSTLLHEMAHWTGHGSRLAREFGRRCGDEAYAFEELVAELSAALLSLHLQTPPATLGSHASYLASWVKVLKHRPGALIEASAHAQRAVDFLLAFSRAEGALAA